MVPDAGSALRIANAVVTGIDRESPDRLVLDVFFEGMADERWTCLFEEAIVVPDSVVVRFAADRLEVRVPDSLLDVAFDGIEAAVGAANGEYAMERGGPDARNALEAQRRTRDAQTRLNRRFT